MAEWDWEGVGDHAVEELQRQGEAYLSAQMSTSLAADQRAMSSATALVAIAAGLVAADATIADVSKIGLLSLMTIAAIAIGLLIAALVCSRAARSERLNSGYEPAALLAKAKDDAGMRRRLVEQLESRILANATTQRTAAAILRAGYLTAAAAIVVPPAVALVWSATLR